MPDRLFPFQQFTQRAPEWHQPLGFAAISTKTFDTGEDRSMWKALRELGIEEPDIRLLQVTAHTDVKSKQAHFSRRTKQGDPLSTLLFNPLPQYIIQTTSEKVEQRHPRRLAEFDRDEKCPNFCLVDDILPISGSLKHTTTMLGDLTTAAMAHGLQLNPTNTKKHLQHDIKHHTRQHGRSSGGEHRGPTTERGNPNTSANT